MGEKAVIVAPEADPLRELAAECISLLRHCIEHAAEAEDAMVQCRIGDGLLAKFAKMKQAEDVSGKRSKAVEDWLAGMLASCSPMPKVHVCSVLDQGYLLATLQNEPFYARLDS